MRLLEIIAVGMVPKHPVTQGCCSKVMTGAMVPQGTECVLMVENALEERGTVRCTGTPDHKTNICLQGEDLSKSAQVLGPGCLIHPQHIAILAAVGVRKGSCDSQD